MDFEERISKLIRDSINECRYTPHYFMRMRTKYGGVEATKRLLHRPDDPSGFVRLWELRRLDLSLEKVVLEPEWRNLFTDEELKVAQRRLDECGYKPKT